MQSSPKAPEMELRPSRLNLSPPQKGNSMAATMTTRILNCKCKHADQDALYGAGKRVHNPMKPGSGKVRCSVCGNIVIVGVASEEVIQQSKAA